MTSSAFADPAHSQTSLWHHCLYANYNKRSHKKFAEPADDVTTDPADEVTTEPTDEVTIDGVTEPPLNSPSTCNVNEVCGTSGVEAAPCACSPDCGSFVNCANGVGKLQACGEGLVFSSAGYCDWARNYNCQC